MPTSTSTATPLPTWLPADEWPFASRSMTVGDDIVHFTDVGYGPTILFVEAGMWSFIWRDVIDRLQTNFRCVTLDFPGSGLSSRTSRDHINIDAYAAILTTVIDRLQLQDITLVVHDLGGAVGLRYASRHPDNIRALVATQTFGWPAQQKALRAMLAMMGSAPMRAINVTTNLVPRITARNYGIGRHLTRAGRRAFLAGMSDRQKRRTFHYLMHDASRSRETLATIEHALQGPLSTKPLLTIFGQKQDPFGYQKRWKELFPNAVEHVVAKGHHYPMNDDPDLFANALRDFATE
jgi:pimeloyl-ACP methyl ester carboxylesterase